MINMNSSVDRVKEKDLFNFCVDVFMKVGAPRGDAEAVSEHLVLANLRGLDSHGAFIRLPGYLPDIEKGLINVRPNISIVKETGSTALLDGDNCLGQIAAMKATELAIEKAKAMGLGIVGARNINHVGFLAHYALEAVNHRLIGLACTSSFPYVVPWGGRKPVFGTNPLCIGFPIDGKKSIILDMATSSVSGGKIAVAAAKEQTIPKGWALDRNGKPITDPKKFLKEGMLLPFGRYKGYGLSLSVEVLAGILMGSPNIDLRPSWAAQGGFLIEAIDVSIFRPYEDYQKDLFELVRVIKSCPLAEGFDRIMLPGELELEEYEKRSREGVPVYKESLEYLKKLSEELDIPPPVLVK
jgi:LDH2 family malate/lactate/ureidoglycolate dehydrogenase